MGMDIQGIQEYELSKGVLIVRDGVASLTHDLYEAHVRHI